MPGTATIQGGASHGVTPLSHSEFQAAQKALGKLSSPSTSVASRLSTAVLNATVSSGTHNLATPAFVHGGSDTFAGGVKSASAAHVHTVGSDTVVSGSTSTVNKVPAHANAFSLSADTINVSGVTAATIKSIGNQNTSSHTISVGEKTKINIAGLSSHDISKLHH